MMHLVILLWVGCASATVCILPEPCAPIILAPPKDNPGLGHQLATLFTGAAFASEKHSLYLARGWFQSKHGNYSMMEKYIRVPIASSDGTYAFGNPESCCGEWCFTSRPYAVQMGMAVLKPYLDIPCHLQRGLVVWHFRTGDITLVQSKAAILRMRDTIHRRHQLGLRHVFISQHPIHVPFDGATLHVGRTIEEDVHLLLSAQIVVGTGSSLPIMLHALSGASGCPQMSYQFPAKEIKKGYTARIRSLITHRFFYTPNTVYVDWEGRMI
jgi:hypothetical protein